MSSSNLSVRLDNTIRAEAEAIFEGYGLSANQAIKMFFKEVAATRKIPLNLDYQAIEKQPTAKLLNAITELENGETSTYESIDELMSSFSR